MRMAPTRLALHSSNCAKIHPLHCTSVPWQNLSKSRQQLRPDLHHTTMRGRLLQREPQRAKAKAERAKARHPSLWSCEGNITAHQLAILSASPLTRRQGVQIRRRNQARNAPRDTMFAWSPNVSGRILCLSTAEAPEICFTRTLQASMLSKCS